MQDTTFFFKFIRAGCLPLHCFKCKPGYLKSLMKCITVLLLTSFLLLLLDVTVQPSACACHLKIFVCSGCFLGKEFKKCSKTLKPDWLPSNVFLLKVSPVWGLVKCTSAWYSLCGCQVCEPVGSQGNVTCCNQSPGNFYFTEE